MRVGMNMME